MSAEGTTVLLLQHGEKQRRAGDPGLTALGHSQALAAARFLCGLGPSRLVSSPLLRARETIAPLAHAAGLPVTTDDRLRERMNLEQGQDPEQFFAEWQRTLIDRHYLPYLGRSSTQTGDDMLSAIDAVGDDGGVVVIAVHGGATIDLLRTILGDAEVEARCPGLITQGVPGAAITTLAGGAGAWQVRQIASLAHLRSEDITGHVR